MSSGLVIETPLINFYYLFCIKYNIMFVKLIEESIYSGNKIVKYICVIVNITKYIVRGIKCGHILIVI